jgi:uncharacterized protein (DUF58 family)
VTEIEAAPLAGRWTRRPTRRGVATAVLGGVLLAAGAYWRYPGVLGLGGSLLALAVLGFLSVLRRAPVSVRRTVRPLEVTRFAPCGATLRIRRSGGLLPIGVDAVEHVGGRPFPVRVPRLTRGGTAEIAYQIPTERRGRLAVGPLEMRRRALAGLAENRAALGGTVQVRVLPRVLPVYGMPSGVRRSHTGADERVEHGGTDLVGLREYAPGDDLRRLHWATSARTGRLMVREDADPSEAHLTVLLDDRAGSYPDADMEDAVDVAASLAVAAADTGHGVRLLTVCGQLDLTALATAGMPAGLAAQSLASALADVTGQEADAEPAPLPASALDVVVALTGTKAALGALVVEAGRAAVGVVAVLDKAAGRGGRAVAAGPVTILRGADSETLLGLWDTVVVSS